MAAHGIMDARRFSFIGRNVSLYMGRYDVCLSGVFSGTFAEYIYAHVQASYDTAALDKAEFLNELLKVRDGLLVLPSNNLPFTAYEISHIVDFICTD